MFQKHHWIVRFLCGLPGVFAEVVVESQGQKSELVSYFFNQPIMEVPVQTWMKQQNVNQKIVSEISFPMELKKPKQIIL